MEVQTIQPPADLSADVGGITAWAKALVISTKDQYADAAERLKQIKTIGGRVAAFFKPMKLQADAAKKAILDAEKQMAGPLDEAERFAKAALLKFQQAEEAKAEAERKRLQAIADAQAAKEKAAREAEAATQRQIEEDARRKANEARAKAAVATAAEKRRLDAIAQRADAKAAEAAGKADNKTAEAAAVMAPTVLIDHEPAKVAGVNVRKVWKFEIIDRLALCKYICDNQRHDLLIINEKVIDAYAKSMTKNATMPGVRFFEASTIASGRA